MQETQETWVQSLGGEDPLEKEMAILSSILAWQTPWTEEPGGLQSMRSQRVRHHLTTEHTQMPQLRPSTVILKKKKKRTENNNRNPASG